MFVICRGVNMNLKSALLALCLCISNPVHAQTDKNNDFKLAMSVTFKRMIQSYAQGEPAALGGDILDSSMPNVAQFFGRRSVDVVNGQLN